MGENGERFTKYQKLTAEQKLDYLYVEVVAISDWKKRLTSLPAKTVYFVLAGLSVATFLVNVMK